MLGWRTRLSVILGYMAQRRPDDALIVAHPRSGSTWLRTILTNIIDPQARSNPEVFNRRIPAVSVRTVQSTRQLPSPRLMTSHTMYLPGLPRVVYVVRDGRDVLISYFNYLNYRRPQVKRGAAESPVADFRTFFDAYYRGAYGTIWHKHVAGWLEQAQSIAAERLKIVRYEDMRADTLGEVRGIAHFLALPEDEDRIARAVEFARLENVRKIEKQEWAKKGLGAPADRTSFYGVGGTRNWEAYFTDEMMQHYLAVSARANELAGYS